MKMEKNRLKNKLKIGILFFGVSLLLWSCVYDDFKENEEDIEQINSLDNSIIEKITYDELPEEFINKYLNYVNKSENSFLSKKSGKVVFEKRIKQKITKVTSSNGIITYNVIVIPIKSKTVFYKNNDDDDDDDSENECNSEPDHSVISMNVGSDGTQTGLYQTNFYFTDGQALNNGQNSGSRFGFYTNMVNLGLGNIFHNSGNSTGSSSTTKCIKKKGKGGAGIGIFFENVWDKIKRIFKSRAQVMPGGCLTSTSEASDEINGNIVLIDGDILYDFNIPIEDDDLEPSSLNRDTPEAFDCACDNDSPYGIAAYLKLQNAYSSIIFDEEQVELRTSICDFVKNNNYSEEAINWAKEAIALETILEKPLQVKQTGLIPSELASCCPGGCCPSSDYNNDLIIKEYGIQPIQAAVDGTFNLIVSFVNSEMSEEWVGKRVRRIMTEIGMSVPSDVTNEHLAALFKIRKRNGVVIVEYREGILKEMLDFGLNSLDMIAFLTPSKGGGAFLASKIGGISITKMTVHLRKIAVNNKKVDDVVNTLNPKARFELNGTGQNSVVKGHHPLAKSAFRSDKFYDLKKAFSVSANSLGGQAVHNAITGNQNRLYSAFAKKGEVLTLDKMADIEIQAMFDAGIPKDIATGWVIKALQDLKAQGVKIITHIPWNGIN